jgi:hypothetical protein
LHKREVGWRNIGKFDLNSSDAYGGPPNPAIPQCDWRVESPVGCAGACGHFSKKSEFKDVSSAKLM